MSRCRFLIDECVPSSLVRGLRRRLPEVSVAQVGELQAPPKGISDQGLLKSCEANQRLLVTADRASMVRWVKEHQQAGGRTWGVLLIGPNASVGQILDELTLIYEASEDSEWTDVLLFLPLSV